LAPLHPECVPKYVTDLVLPPPMPIAPPPAVVPPGAETEVNTTVPFGGRGGSMVGSLGAWLAGWVRAWVVWVCVCVLPTSLLQRRWL
jgi:hypothetical protein